MYMNVPVAGANQITTCKGWEIAEEARQELDAAIKL